jgi:PAS domain S-box-containing protein
MRDIGNPFMSLTEQNAWVGSNSLKMMQVLNLANSVSGFGNLLLSSLVPLLGGAAAALYALDDGVDLLRRIASFGMSDNPEVPVTIPPGVGLIGQCAKEQKPIFLTDLPPTYFRIVSGLGSAMPDQVAALPLLAGGKLVGIVEVAKFGSIDVRQTALLEAVLPSAARTLKTLSDAERAKEALNSVRVSDEHGRLVLEATAEGIFCVDSKGRINFANRAAHQLLGFQKGAMAGQPSGELLPFIRADGSEAPDEESPIVGAYSRGDAVQYKEGSWKRADGILLSVRYSIAPIHRNGTIVGAVVSFSDDTKRKRADRKLREASFLATVAMGLTGSGYWHVDYSDPDYYYQSELAARVLGEEIKPDGRYHLQEEWFSRLIDADPELAQKTDELYQGAIVGRYEHYDAVYPYKRPADGQIIWLHAAGRVVRGEDGKAQHMYGVYQDITENKRRSRRSRRASSACVRPSSSSAACWNSRPTD